MSIAYSVIIVTYNSAEWIRECLASINDQRGECQRLEVVVVDNASTDETMAIVQKEFPEAVTIANERNVGFASAVNQGAARAQCDRLILLNPDSKLQPGFFAALNSFAASQPGAGIAGGALLGSDGQRQPSCWKTPSLWTALLESALPYGVSLPFVTDMPDRTREVETVSGACMIVRKQDFLGFGSFDTRFFMYYEDLDLCMRARLQGMKVFFISGASVVHHSRKSTESAGEMFFLHVYESKLKLLEKHESRPAYLLAYLIIIAGIALRIPVYAIAGKLLKKQELLQLSKYHTFVLPKIAAGLLA